MTCEQRYQSPKAKSSISVLSSVVMMSAASTSVSKIHTSNGISNAGATMNNSITNAEGRRAAAPHGTASGPTAVSSLEGKLHAAITSMRQSRDEAHRFHHLASQRLRAVTDEYNAMLTSVETTTKHVTTLREKVAPAPTTLAETQRTVQKLNEEVNFQHADLMGKRDQLVELRNAMKVRDTERKEYLIQLRAMVQKQRNNAYHQKQQDEMNINPTKSTGAKKESDILATASVNPRRYVNVVPPTALVDAWHDRTDGINDQKCRRWSMWIQDATRKLHEATIAQERDTALLKNVIEGYDKTFPTSNGRDQTIDNESSESAACHASDVVP